VVDGGGQQYRCFEAFFKEKKTKSHVEIVAGSSVVEVKCSKV